MLTLEARMIKPEYTKSYSTVSMMASVMLALKDYSVEEVAVICKRYKEMEAIRKTRPSSHRNKHSE